MSTLITNYGFGHPKFWEDVLLEKLENHYMVIVFVWGCLNPLRNIIYSYQDVTIAKRHREWSHEVNAPNKKKTNYQNGVQRHHVPTCQLPKPLASITTLAYGVGIFEKWWTTKTRLQHPHGYLLRRKVASTCIFMAMTEDPLLLFFRNTLPYYLIAQYLNRNGSSQ